MFGDGDKGVAAPQETKWQEIRTEPGWRGAEDNSTSENQRADRLKTEILTL